MRWGLRSWNGARTKASSTTTRYWSGRVGRHGVESRRRNWCCGWKPDPVVLIAVTALALVTWVSWAVIIVHIGGRYFAERQTHVDLGQLMRTTGFAASPGLLQVFASIPEITVPVYLVSWLWMLVAMTVAVRQALDFRTMRRALAVCGVVFGLVLAFAITLAMLFSPRPPRRRSTGCARTRSSNT